MRLDLHGWPVVVSDTAGLRETTDDIEREGIARAGSAAEMAQVVVVVVDAAELEYNQDTAATIQQGQFVQDFVSEHVLRCSNIDGVERRVLVVFNKVDRVSHNKCGTLSNGLVWGGAGNSALALQSAPQHWTSCVDGTGIEELVAHLGSTVRGILQPPTECADGFAFAAAESSSVSEESICVTRLRHRQHLERCVAQLDAALTFHDHDVDLAAEELRGAVASLGRVTGTVDVEDVLEVIFQEFCIGK